MKIKDLPIEIQKLAELRWSECKHPGKHKTFDINKEINNAFEYSATAEDSDFWFAISRGEFDEYYKLYPKVVEPKINSIIDNNNQKIYHAIIGKKKAKITIEYYE